MRARISNEGNGDVPTWPIVDSVIFGPTWPLLGLAGQQQLTGLQLGFRPLPRHFAPGELFRGAKLFSSGAGNETFVFLLYQDQEKDRVLSDLTAKTKRKKREHLLDQRDFQGLTKRALTLESPDPQNVVGLSGTPGLKTSSKSDFNG